MSELFRILFVFAWAFGLAAVEVEIEGRHGWAEKLPTWFRVKGTAARLYGAVMRGRPLTGYHAFMFVLPLFGFHWPFLEGAPWSLAAEARALATYLAWAVAWDFLWFVLNPAYGWDGFRRGRVWWYPPPWVLRLPVDHWAGAGISLALGALSGVLPGGGGLLRGLGLQLALVAGLAALSALTVLVAPRYHRWYRHMRRPGADERAAAGLAPREEP